MIAQSDRKRYKNVKVIRVRAQKNPNLIHVHVVCLPNTDTHTHTHFTPFDLVLINATPDFSIFGELTGIVIWDPYQLPYV